MCNFSVKVHNPQTDLCNEIKRIGYIRDRESPIELRVGDTLILYMSTSVAWVNSLLVFLIINIDTIY